MLKMSDAPERNGLQQLLSIGECGVRVERDYQRRRSLAAGESANRHAIVVNRISRSADGKAGALALNGQQIARRAVGKADRQCSTI